MCKSFYLCPECRGVCRLEYFHKNEIYLGKKYNPIIKDYHEKELCHTCYGEGKITDSRLDKCNIG